MGSEIIYQYSYEIDIIMKMFPIITPIIDFLFLLFLITVMATLCLIQNLLFSYQMKLR